MFGFGWRKRIGCISPSVMEVISFDFYRFAPDGVGFVGVTDNTNTWSSEDIDTALNGALASAAYLGDRGCDFIVHTGAAHIASKGPGHDVPFLAEMQRRAGVGATTSIRSAISALTHLGARRIAVASPWPERITGWVTEYVASEGIEIAGVKSFGIDFKILHTLQPPEIYRFATEVAAAHPGIDALYMPGPQAPVAMTVPFIERDAGIPVVSINSGSTYARKFGVLLHVGQPEYDAGKGAGERAKAAGVKKYLCLNQEAENIALRERCQGFADGFGQKLNMIDTTNDPAEIKSRTTAALMADPKIDTLLATGPHVCAPALAALHDLGKERSIYLACFDLSPEIVAAIKDGRVAFAVDQQQYLQGFLPVIALDLYKRYGLLQANDVLSGPGFVTKENAAQVAKLAGTVR